MYKNKTITGFLFLILITLSINTSGYTYLEVNSPQGFWSSTACIDSATVTVQPKGAYFEYGVYLTFSAKNSAHMSSNDSLEVVYNFDLPKEAIMVDSWLWIYDKPEKALLLDRWTASNIYEGIVKRRRDPSILTYNGNGQYHLRVYPMALKGTRKVKFTYLLPATWGNSKINVPIPVSIFQPSVIKPVYTVKYLTAPGFNKPTILEYPSMNLTAGTDSLGNYFQGIFNIASIVSSSLNLQLDSPLKNGVFVSNYTNGKESFFQMIIDPNKVLNVSNPKKVVFLFDYDGAANYPKADIFAAVKSQLLGQLNSKDSFNLIFSNLNINRIAQNWIPGDSASIENTFSKITSTTLSSYSNLAGLMGNGIDFINTHGKAGQVVLVANSQQVVDFQVANQLSADLIKLMEKPYPVHVCDFTSNPKNYYSGGVSYRGNEYFYLNLTKTTGGNYFNTFQGNVLVDIIGKTLNGVNNTVQSLDLITTLKSGFCYGRYTPTGINGYNFITQVGKYNGTPPFQIQISGLVNNLPYTNSIEVQSSDLVSGDSSIQKMWAGNHIRSLEQTPSPSNSVVRSIIETSMEYRVLSTVTAFLTLEPNFNNTTGAAGDTKSSTSLWSASNPFKDETEINFSLAENANLNDVTIEVYNLMGQLVKSFTKDEIEKIDDKYKITWNGSNQAGQSLHAGIYCVMLSSKSGKKTMKLVKTE